MFIEKLRYRISKEPYKQILTYHLLLKDKNKLTDELYNHINDYFKAFLYAFFFGRLQKFTIYGYNIRKKHNQFFDSGNCEFNLKEIYSYKNSPSIILEKLNQSHDNSYFAFYGIKFVLKNDLDFQRTLLGEINDLVIPYYCKNHLIYNESSLGEGTYETEEVFVSEGDIVFDVGANMGIFSNFCILKRRAKCVFSFEPIKSTFIIIELNCILNGTKSDIQLVNRGLSNFDGKIDMSISSDNIGANSMVFSRSDNLSESVLVTTLDSYIETNSIKKVDFIKVDIEGAERDFLEGARLTLSKFKPKLAICTYHFIDDPVVLTKLILEANPNYKISYNSKKLFAV
jgi:FkbM family methyltransferase